jgi:hypothetical protein
MEKENYIDHEKLTRKALEDLQKKLKFRQSSVVLKPAQLPETGKVQEDARAQETGDTGTGGTGISVSNEETGWTTKKRASNAGKARWNKERERKAKASNAANRRWDLNREQREMAIEEDSSRSSGLETGSPH